MGQMVNASQISVHKIKRTLESIRALENIGALIDFNGVGRGRGELKTFEK